MTSKSSFIVFRFVGALILVALIAGGIFMAFNAGVARGISEAPAVAKAISQAAENGQVAPLPPMMYQQSYGFGPGYPMMYGRHHFGFFPGGICLSIIFIFLFLGIMRMIFFRGMWHRGWEGHKHGPWGRHWENGVPSMFEEWHKRAHDEKPVEDGDKESSR